MRQGKAINTPKRETGKKTVPPLPDTEFLSFASDEEKAEYYLLQSLDHIRTEHPASYRSVDFDWKGVCTVVQIPLKVGLRALGLLDEAGLINGLKWQGTEIVGVFEPYGRVYINTYGIDHYRGLERAILDRAQEVVMPDVVGNAVLILRCMADQGAIGVTMISSRELRGLSGLSEEEYAQADSFLRGQKYVKATLGADGRRWTTASGIAFLNGQMSRRIRLSLAAERIARFLFGQSQDSYQATRSQIQEALQLGTAESQKAACELIDEGLAENALRVEQASQILEIDLTSTGRRAVRNNFTHSTTPGFQQNVGAIFYGAVSDSNVLAVAQAHQWQVQQVINDGDVAALRDEIRQLVEQVVEAVKGDLTAGQLAVYAGAAKELSTEIAKENPSSSVIHRCLNALSFAGDLDGTIELGRKTIELACKAAPLVSLLWQAIIALLG